MEVLHVCGTLPPDQGTAISKQAIFSPECSFSRKDAEESRVSSFRMFSWSNHCSRGDKDSVSHPGHKEWFVQQWHHCDITTTALVNKPLEFFLLNYLVSDKTTLIALVINCCNSPSCIERVSHCCLTWLQAIRIFREKAISSPRGSDLKKKISFYLTVVKEEQV